MLNDLKVVILAGGKSTRMGEDKSQIRYIQHLTEIERLSFLCKELKIDSFVSRGASNLKTEIVDFEVIEDRHIDQGPLAAIFAAFTKYPHCAWLVLACDMPFIDLKAIDYLIDNRNKAAFATCYYHEKQDRVEPLFAIYESKMLPIIEQSITQNQWSPSTLLNHLDIEKLNYPNELIFSNINTQKEKMEAFKIINT